ncbi:MAG TPA: hypothetical protein VGE47_14455, partial [Burkholderiaceae bacterium]
MTEQKDGESFFRKVARFVANPTTDWAELNSRQDNPEADAAKAELRAMVERKRRNDFVRKRELDMLRRIRREGLSSEQLAALGSATSRLDEIERSGGRSSDIDANAENGVKAKIDKIEQQMVGGDSYAATQMQGLQGAPAQGFFETSTRPVHFSPSEAAAPSVQAAPQDPPSDFLRGSPGLGLRPVSSLQPAADDGDRSAAAPAAATMGAGLSPLSSGPPSRLPDLHFDAKEHAPLSFDIAGKAAPPAPQAPVPPAEQNELGHDPELDEAVIAFANADYEACEASLVALTRPGGLRHQQADSWLVLFDLYRAIGQQAKFEALALEYAQQFGLSAPQWFSLPKLVAEAARSERVPRVQAASGASWTAPAHLSNESLDLLQQRCDLMPLPWVLDWSALQRIDVDAALRLRSMFRSWANQPLDIRWLAGDQFIELLRELTPVSERDADEAYWMLRLEALRLVNRPDQFDEAAIDYCVTYEVSPPSWERVKCRVKVSGHTLSTQGAPTSTM